jgi:hypothetical protein
LAGQTYYVTFDIASNPTVQPWAAVKTIEISAAGQSQQFTADSTGHTLTEMGWETHTWSFVAQSTSTELWFYMIYPDYSAEGMALDNVRVEVPEPASAVLLVFGGFLVMVRGARRFSAGILPAGVVIFIAVCGLSSTASAGDWLQWGTNGHSYKAISVPGGINWDVAQAAATAEGGYLATITSPEENGFVFSLINYPQFWNMADYTMGPWLGGYQPEGSSEPVGGWTWVTGEPFSYTNWYPGEPNNDPNENWLHFSGGWGGPPSNCWNDATINGTGRAVVGYVIEVPEPASFLLLALGGVAVRRRRLK